MWVKVTRDLNTKEAFNIIVQIFSKPTEEQFNNKNSILHTLADKLWLWRALKGKRDLIDFGMSLNGDNRTEEERNKVVHTIEENLEGIEVFRYLQQKITEYKDFDVVDLIKELEDDSSFHDAIDYLWDMPYSSERDDDTRVMIEEMGDLPRLVLQWMIANTIMREFFEIEEEKKKIKDEMTDEEIEEMAEDLKEQAKDAE